MSVYYEVVFACFLRDETPEESLDALRWHLGQLADRPASLMPEDDPDRLLCPNPASRLPGGDIASLSRQLRRTADGQEVHAWGLFSRTLCPDENLSELATIMALLAANVADDGYGGYYRDVDAAEATAFAFTAATSDQGDEPGS